MLVALSEKPDHLNNVGLERLWRHEMSSVKYLLFPSVNGDSEAPVQQRHSWKRRTRGGREKGSNTTLGCIVGGTSVRLGFKRSFCCDLDHKLKQKIATGRAFEMLFPPFRSGLRSMSCNTVQLPHARVEDR